MDDTNTEKKPAAPLTKKSSRFHIIWLLPLCALIICIILTWNAYKSESLEITLQFTSAQGIIAGKTNVVYNGVVVGQVKHIRATDDLKKVNVQITMDDKLKPWLTDKTEFWLVKPNVSLSGITGLETLVSGNYIAIKPNNTGKPVLNFTALNRPPSENDLPGLHISLVTEKLHSVTIGSPVYFNQIEVGKITDYSLHPKTHNIIIYLVIEPEYASLVHHNSRFWSVSGFDLQASLKGVRVHAESLSSLVKGGIAFYTPTWEPHTPAASNGDQFILYDSVGNAQLGIAITIRFPLLHSAISKGTPVIFHGLEIGKVTNVDIDNDLEHFTAQVIIKPSAKNLLVEGTHFWMIRPQISLSGVSDVSSLINGPYIAIDSPKQAIKKGIEKKHFEGYENRHYAPLNMPGLNFILKAASLHGLKIKSPLLYKGLSIGSIEHIHLSDNGKEVLVFVNILPTYKHLVNQSSIFENISGFSVNASFSGIQVKSNSLAAIVSGGIRVSTTNPEAKAIKPDSILPLHTNNPADHNNLKLALITDDLGSIKKGVPVLYLGVPVGKVTGYHLDNPANKVVIDVTINSQYKNLVTTQSQFWNISGIQVDASLFNGIHVKTRSLQTIAIGGIAFATPHSAKQPIKEGQRFILHKNEEPEWAKWRPAIKIAE